MSHHRCSHRSPVTRALAPLASDPQSRISPMSAALASIALGCALLAVYTSQTGPETPGPGLCASFAVLYALFAGLSLHHDRTTADARDRDAIRARLYRLARTEWTR